MSTEKFEFKGAGISYWWLTWWTGFLSIVTIGIFIPWAFCAKQRWIARRTFIDGRPLVFKGSGFGIFGNMFIIILLSIITLGIYYPWGWCKIQRWKVNNLKFADDSDIQSMKF